MHVLLLRRNISLTPYLLERNVIILRLTKNDPQEELELNIVENKIFLNPFPITDDTLDLTFPITPNENLHKTRKTKTKEI